MYCNTGQRKIFADDVLASLQAVLKKYGVGDVIVHREGDPVFIAARGCLKTPGSAQTERVELVLQISPDLRESEQQNQQGVMLAPEAPVQVSRAFDISESVAYDSVARAPAMNDDDICSSEN